MTSLLKSELMNQLLEAIDQERNALSLTVHAVVDAATHEQSKPENQYDTRALEASYLAGAQQERLRELTAIRQNLAIMLLKNFDEHTPIASTAVVQLNCDGTVSEYFLLPYAAGYTLKLNGQKISTLSIAAPLGRGLLGKTVGEFITIEAAGTQKDYEITKVL